MLHLTEADLLRVLVSLLRAELAALRQCPARSLGAETWTAETPLGTGGLNADVREQIALATATTRRLLPHEGTPVEHLLRHRTLGEWARIVHEQSGECLAFLTSGSTGTPKTCRHAYKELTEEAQELACLFRDRRRVIAVVPCHHLYGFLFTVLLPRILDVPVVEAWPWRAQDLAEGDLVVSHPTHWSRLQQSLPSFPKDVTGTTSTAPCDPDLIEQLRGQGLARMVEVYGSSETAGVGYREHPAQPYRLFPFWERHGDALRRRTPQGILGPSIAPMDALTWEDDRHFRPGPRLDHAVQVAGVNVYPVRVAQTLREHPQIEDCAVRLMRPDEGQRLKAFLVLRAGVSWNPEIRASLDEWAQQRLHAPERPEAYTVGPALPLGSLDKPADWPIDTALS